MRKAKVRSVTAEHTAKHGVTDGQRVPPGLYVIATPIGNLEDITLRAMRILGAVDLVAAEDSRVAAKLLAHIGSRVPVTAYHDHNGPRARPRLLAALAAGKAVALISDAGTPLISDPGMRLVAEAAAAGYPVVPVPGASAPLAALAAAGLPSDRFLFAGFLSPKAAARRKALGSLAGVRATLIFFEAPQRLSAMLADCASQLGDRPACIARELTKLHEEFRRGGLGDLAAHYADAPTPKGEIVVLVGPPGDLPVPDERAVDAMLARALAAGDSVRSAAQALAEATGLPRRSLYARAQQLKASAEKAAQQ